MAHWLPEVPRELPELEDELEAEVVAGAGASVVFAGGGAT
jgi:hypothetical protein